jgi:hypothetical protein
MNNTEMSLATVNVFNVVNNRRCPQCGSSMNEEVRYKEGAITYVWFECVRTDCDGQWMQSYLGLFPR